jgi:beta-glucosidase
VHSASGRGGLPITGADSLPWIGGGIVLVGLGTALTLLARRRRA